MVEIKIDNSTRRSRMLVDLYRVALSDLLRADDSCSETGQKYACLVLLAMIFMWLGVVYAISHLVA